MLDYSNIPITFYMGDESRVVEETGDPHLSIFKSQYERAIDIVHEFWNQDENEKLTVPNIVAFCGYRGEGKTSCMLSTTHLMKNVYGEETFEILDTIDPSFFDEKHNIIELVLGQLYGRFLKIDKCTGREELLEAFNNVKGCLSTITKGTDNVYDAIEELDELGNGMVLQDLMGKLLKLYLDYAKRSILVVVIDDMDYNWKRAYEMTQMISKYLCHHQCILMISVSISQMVEVVETSFKNELRPMGNSTNFYEVAYKYVEKLIPLQYRVEMPHVYDLCNRQLDIYKRYGGNRPIAHYDTIKEGLVREIFIKTRYLFYNYQDGVSQIVPRNLRMLRQLLGLLLKMDVYHKDSKDPVKRDSSQQNKLLFQSYFFTNWTRQLNKKNQAFVKNLMTIQDLSQMNKLVVGYIKSSLPDVDIAAFADIIKPSNYSYNISVGDVFSLLTYIERNPKEENDQMLVFFLKSYYSMLLYHYYDEITESAAAIHPESVSGGIYRTESWFKDTNKLQRFVNGNYFHYNHGELLRGKVQGETLELDCDQFIVGAPSVTNLTDKVIIAINKKEEDITEEDKQDILRAELFILMTSWGSEREIGNNQKKPRDIPQPHHLLRFNDQTVSFMFDILAPFCNLVNIKFAYNRFKVLTGDLYEFAYLHDWTLLHQMMVAASEGKDAKTLEDMELCLASDAIIRNAEVLTSLKEKIQSIASTGGDARKMTDMIANFYQKIINSEMVTYPTAQGEDPYTINFKFLKPVCKLLKETDAGAFYDLVTPSQLLRKESSSSSSSSL